MITVSVEDLTKCLTEMVSILDRHWEEVALFDGRLKFNPDFATYFKLEDMGVLSIVVARLDGKMVGYMMDIVTPSVHFEGQLQSMNDNMFIEPDHRQSEVFNDMTLLMEEVAKDKGAVFRSVLMKTSKKKKTKTGYELIEQGSVKYLGDK